MWELNSCAQRYLRYFRYLAHPGRAAVHRAPSTKHRPRIFDAERTVALRITTRRFGYLPAMVYDYALPGAQ